MSKQEKAEAVAKAVAYIDASPDNNNTWGFLTAEYPNATSEEKLAIFTKAWNVIEDRA